MSSDASAGRWALLALLLLALAPGASCYRPSYGESGFTCPDGRCPEGLRCCAGQCLDVAQCPARHEAGLPDGAGPDQRTADLAPDRGAPDLRLPDTWSADAHPPGCTKPVLLSKDTASGQALGLKAGAGTFDLHVDRRDRVHVALVTDTNTVWYAHPGSPGQAAVSFAAATGEASLVSLAADGRDQVFLAYTYKESINNGRQLAMQVMDASSSIADQWTSITPPKAWKGVNAVELDAFALPGGGYDVYYVLDRIYGPGLGVSMDLRFGKLALPTGGGVYAPTEQCVYTEKNAASMAASMHNARLGVGKADTVVSFQVGSVASSDWRFRAADHTQSACTDAQFQQVSGLDVASDGVALAQGTDAQVHAVYVMRETTGKLGRLKHCQWTGNGAPTSGNTDTVVATAVVDPRSVDVAMDQQNIPVITWFEVPTGQAPELRIARFDGQQLSHLSKPGAPVARHHTADPTQFSGYPTRVEVDSRGVIHVLFALQPAKGQALTLRYVTCR